MPRELGHALYSGSALFNGDPSDDGRSSVFTELDTDVVGEEPVKKP